MEPTYLAFRRWLYTPCSSSDIQVIGSLGSDHWVFLPTSFGAPQPFFRHEFRSLQDNVTRIKRETQKYRFSSAADLCLGIVFFQKPSGNCLCQKPAGTWSGTWTLLKSHSTHSTCFLGNKSCFFWVDDKGNSEWYPGILHCRLLRAKS